MEQFKLTSGMGIDQGYEKSEEIIFPFTLIPKYISSPSGVPQFITAGHVTCNFGFS